MILGGVVLAVMAGLAGEFAAFDVSAVSRDSFVAFLYLTVVGSIVAFTTSAGCCAWRPTARHDVCLRQPGRGGHPRVDLLR